MKTILVLDDEESIRTLLNDILTDEGYKVILSDDGEEVMDILKKEKVDLIITDMMMPKANGQEIYTSIRVAFAQENKLDLVPPAIVLTAHPGADKTQFLLMMEEGIKKIVCKPFQIDELLSAVKEFIS
ncbi:MAG: response regulator [Spirochaetota bacterium]|jgi:DNA-binding response OmpR family regulator|nr:response regulator [Spirochaetota bacterium]